MTSTFSLKRPDVFPVGSKVDVYELARPLAATPQPWPAVADVPQGTIKQTVTVDAAGTAAFTGLTDGKPHVAVAEQGLTLELRNAAGLLVATVAATKPLPFTLTIAGAVDENWTTGATFTWNGGTPTVVAGPAALTDLATFVAANGGTLTVAGGITSQKPKNGTFAASYASGAASYRRVYFSTPGGAVTSAVGSSVVSYDAAEASRWPSWRTRRRQLGLV